MNPKDDFSIIYNQYYTTVRCIALRYCVSRYIYNLLEDLISEGFIGLYEAYKKYDETRGVKFGTYVRPYIHFRIIDFIRANSFYKRSVYQKWGRMLQDELNALCLSFKQLKFIYDFQNYVKCDYLSYENELAIYDNPSIKYENAQLIHTLVSDSCLNAQEKEVLSLYYEENLVMLDISKILNVTESRISQIHTKAMEKLKRKYAKQKDILLFH